MSVKLTNTQLAVILVGLAVLILFVTQPTLFSGSTINVNAPPSTPGSSTTIITIPSTPPVIPENNRAPTAISAFVSPNPVNVGGWVLGTLTSDGYNYPVTVYAKHIGSGQTTTIPASLGSDGKFELTQQINTAGYWEFWAETATGIKSNKANLSVVGMTVQCDRDRYSRTFGGEVIISVYSSYSGNVLIFANHPADSTSVSLTNVAVNSGGYGQVSVALATFPSNGDYEVDALIGSHKASDYGGSYWINIGR